MKANFLLFHIFLGIVFLMSGLIVSFLMLLTLIFVWPYDKTLYRKMIYLLAYSHWSQFTFVAQWWSNSDVTLVLHDAGDKDFIGKEHSIVIMNHKYDIDWLMTWILAERMGMLGGTKVFTKSTLKFMPLLGWAWYFSESIFLRRDWQKDQHTLSTSLSRMRDYPDNYWFTLLLFCEGTRFTPSKHLLSMQFAEKHNLPILKHHLSPRTKGFVASMNGLKGKIPAVVDLTIAFEKDSVFPSMMNVLRGRPTKAVIYAKRIPLEDIPMDSDEACAEWLQQHYKYKDDMYDYFNENGEFPGGTVAKVERRLNDMLMWTFWAVLIGVPTAYLLISFIMYGSLLIQAAGLAALLLGILVVLKLIAISEIKTTSSDYGRQAKNKLV